MGGQSFGLYDNGRYERPWWHTYQQHSLVLLSLDILEHFLPLLALSVMAAEVYIDDGSNITVKRFYGFPFTTLVHLPDKTRPSVIFISLPPSVTGHWRCFLGQKMTSWDWISFFKGKNWLASSILFNLFMLTQG